MSRRQRLGQHFLGSQSVASEIVRAAGISGKDTVLEIGTGSGILTAKLCESAGSVVSVEADPALHRAARSRLSVPNLTLVRGDGFKTDCGFSIFVSNLPYSKSRTAIEWLAGKKFSRAIIMVQREFADKLTGQTRAVSVIANHCFGIERVLGVGKSSFSPPPKVDSVVLRLTRKRTLSRDVIKTVNLLFSYRRKTVSNILREFGMGGGTRQRLDELSGDEIIGLGRKISGR